VRRRFFAALILFLGPGCFGAIDAIDPKVGKPLGARCANEDSDPSHDVSFSKDIQPILRKDTGVPVGCSCHQPTDPNPIGFQQGGLDLSSYDNLLKGGNNSKSTILLSGQPCSSVLWQKISPGPPFGARMPFSGPPFLSDEARQLIADWIAEGARDN
jgi:hypothetical protein